MFTLEGLDVLMRHAVEISFGGGRVSVVPVGNCSNTPWILKVILLP